MPYISILAKLTNMVKKTKITKDDEIEAEKNAESVNLAAAPQPENAGLSLLSKEEQKGLEEMFMAGVHFGYSRSSCHPKMKPYLFGLRNNVEIFDLEKTNSSLKKACDFLENLGKEGKKILIVATKPGISRFIEEKAKEINMPYVSERWLGGILTNFKMIKDRVDYFVGLRQKKISGELNKYTKKEISKINKELGRLERFLKGLELLNVLPNALLIIDPKEEKTALQEAMGKNIPVISVLNSDCDPTDITYPVPGNDASLSSVKYLMEKLIEAYKKGTAQVQVQQ